MKIAIPYNEGNVFEHFGRTKSFKVYDLQNGVIENTVFINADGSGHSELISMLKSVDVELVLCGGIGGKAIQMFNNLGIDVYTGATGNTDDVLRGFMDGSLKLNNTSTCDHHHDDSEEHSCHCHDH